MPFMECREYTVLENSNIHVKKHFLCSDSNSSGRGSDSGSDSGSFYTNVHSAFDIF